MKKNILLIIISVILCGINNMQAQTTVNSLSALIPYLDDDNANIKLAPGTYTITTATASFYGGYETIGSNTPYTLFKFSGNNSTYDFTDVKIQVETGVFREFGNNDVYEIRIAGNNNILKNLTLEDIGSVHDNPRRGALSMAIDGQHNLVEGFHVTAKGSLPYGYGDIFGKGGGSLTPLDKHSGILIRGDYNTLKNTTMIHRAFGHCVFMQAANHPTIEGCYIEGEMRTTDDILTEEGTGSIADNLDFMTTWGYRLPSGFMLALCEAGIRSYNAGTTTINGVSYQRGSNDITIKNTTVKNTRSGCTISQSSGQNHVENVTLIGNENGFAIGRGEVINCYADAAYGPAFNGSSSINGVVTLLDPENGYYNGSKCLASSTGGTFTFNSNVTNIPEDMSIQMGSYRSFRHQEGSNLMYQVTTNFSGATVYNNTGGAIDLGEGSSNCDITTCSIVTDFGSANTINYLDGCEYTGACDNTVNYIRSECFDSMSGIQAQGGHIGFIENGDWAAYNNIDLTNIDLSSVRVNTSSKTSGGTIEVRLDSLTGTLLGTVSVSGTGNWTNWDVVEGNITNVSGVHDLYFVFVGGSGYLFNIDWISFQGTAILGIEDSNTLHGVNIYPNPVINELVINGAEGALLEVFNINGVLEGKHLILGNKEALSLSNLNSGIHFLRFINDSGVQVKKIIKR
ncbi:carbohydrate-binding protein [Seonamhaeicola sp. MEBiC1930]|uniref:carbohydrate-binding protein n=1 Tax=Seonamhaeicola sp. MEBiC01930 TaxID=2976768 RepID=UPI0032555133